MSSSFSISAILGNDVAKSKAQDVREAHKPSVTFKGELLYQQVFHLKLKATNDGENRVLWYLE